jgi:superfamily II DNA or RNA helicase
MATHSFVKRDPDKGYFGRQLWLPRKHINVRSVKGGLEFPIMDDQGLSYLQLWLEDGDHLIVPREFVRRQDYPHLKFPIISAQPSQFSYVAFKSNVVLDFKEPELTIQRDAFKNMMQSKSGILNLACGKGKTVLALHHIAHRKVPALVVVNNTTLINQWQDRIAQFLEVPGGVGIIQGPPDTWDWEGRGICLAMIHSLALRHEELPLGMDRYFGGIYYDEVHHLSAPLFSQTAPLFYGTRQGLTATVNREDGLESVYQYHVGGVYHRDLTQDMKPRIYFQQCPVQVDTRDPAVCEQIYDKAGRLSIPKLRNYLGSLPEVNEFIAEKVQQPLSSGRKVLALSHSVGQLRRLNEMFEDSGLCTGREKPAARLETLRAKQVSFGTLQLVKEALDEDTLDTLFFLTPFGSSSVEEGGFNTLQQGMGRIQRFREGKKTPVVVLIDFIYVPKFHRMCSTLKRQLRNWPVDQGGPLEYTTLKPHSEEVVNG